MPSPRRLHAFPLNLGMPSLSIVCLGLVARFVSLFLLLLCLQCAAAGQYLGETSTRHRRLAIGVQLLESLEVLLSTQSRAPLIWTYTQVQYSLTVPAEAVAAALVVVPAASYDGIEMAMYRPEDGVREDVAAGLPSSFGDVPTEEPARFVLELRYGSQATNYTISVIRSTITSQYEFSFPDPAQSAPPQTTLTALLVYDGFGTPARMASFVPRRSQYVASVEIETRWFWLVASQNDPDATLELRIDGQSWDPMLPGVNSRLLGVPDRGWLLAEIRVKSPEVLAAGFGSLVYQVVVTREVICHERCRKCFGPGEFHCLSCRSPLVLSDGRCEATACPPDGYYEWELYQCSRCHPSCAQCAGPRDTDCRQCPALLILAPNDFSDLTGPCVSSCPIGQHAHPPSRRCRRPPAATVSTFYILFTFRHGYDSFLADPRLQRMVLNATAFVLGLSLSDVRAFRLDSPPARADSRARTSIEVVSPFLHKADADRVSIDTWFGAFEIPLDVAVTQTWAEVHPPLPTLPEEPSIPFWAVGLIFSVAAATCILIPMYCWYFRRTANTRKHYLMRNGISHIFVTQVIEGSPPWLIKQFMQADATGKAAG